MFLQSCGPMQILAILNRLTKFYDLDKMKMDNNSISGILLRWSAQQSRNFKCELNPELFNWEFLQLKSYDVVVHTTPNPGRLKYHCHILQHNDTLCVNFFKIKFISNKYLKQYFLTELFKIQNYTKKKWCM